MPVRYDYSVRGRRRSMSDVNATGAPVAQEQLKAAERRRSALPQPDFTPYEKANAYPGQSYFFVGHSYNVELANAESAILDKRSNAIKALFSEDSQWVPVQHALSLPDFSHTLARFEQDLLTRLPESALIGPAIDDKGNVIAQSFTVWRQERRKQRASDAQQ
jgi:hypothetical protein